MDKPTESSLRNRKAPSKTLHEAPDMSHTTLEKQAFQYDLDEEIVMTPVHTRAVSPTRGRLMPHTAAEADAFMANLNNIVSGNAKDKVPALAALSATDKTRAYLGRFSVVDKAGFLVYVLVFTLTMLAIRIAMVDSGVRVSRHRMTVCG